MSFTYPKGWRVGDNHLEHGTFQLYNYDDSTSSGSVFAPGQDKIEAGIIEGSSLEETASKVGLVDPTADYIPAKGTKFSVIHTEEGGQPTLEIITSVDAKQTGMGY